MYGAKALPATSWRRSVAASPVGAQRVVFFAFFFIAENLVGLVDFLEFVFSLRLVFGDIGMILARQLAKRLSDFIFAGGTFDAQGLVIILKFNSHNRKFNLLRAPKFVANVITLKHKVSLVAKKRNAELSVPHRVFGLRWKRRGRQTPALMNYGLNISAKGAIDFLVPRRARPSA